MTLYSLRNDHGLHSQRGHPERPARLDAVRLQIEQDPHLTDLVHARGPAATRAQLERVHSPDYLDALETFCETGGGMLDVDTYATSDSWRVACEAAGDLLHLTERVLTGEASGAFALGRPPGHHARPSMAMGFCLLANAAVAARHAQSLGAERVMVVDIDVHHGNGTQEAFYDDPDVLVFSSHQADIYPASGTIQETGAGAGHGTTVNLPVPGGTGDAPLVQAYRALLPPLAARFRPDLVIISAGYDAHRLDPLGGLALSVTGLTDLLRVVLEVADTYASGRTVLTLEGGYNADVLAYSVTSALRTLLNPSAEASDPFGPSRHASPDLTPLTEAVRALHHL